MNKQQSRKAADDLIKSFSTQYKTIAAKVSDSIRSQLDSGVSLRKAVDIAFRKYNVEAWMLKTVSDGMVASTLIGMGLKPTAEAIASKTLTAQVMANSYSGSRYKLSVAVHQRVNAAKAVITETVKESIVLSDGVDKAAIKLFRGYRFGSRIGLEGTKVNGALNGLAQTEIERISALRRTGIPTPMSSATAKKIKSMQAYVNKMDKFPLRTSYNELLGAIKREKLGSIQKSLYVATQEKARSHAMMIAQSEMSNSYGVGFETAAVKDPDVAGIQYSLCTSHSIYDICDIHTSLDSGYGPGVYPLTTKPVYPFHPRCTCRMSNVFIDEIPVDAKISGKQLNKSMQDKLKSLPKSKREKVLGKEGKTENWQSNLRNWQGHEAAKNSIPT